MKLNEDLSYCENCVKVQADAR